VVVQDREKQTRGKEGVRSPGSPYGSKVVTTGKNRERERAGVELGGAGGMHGLVWLYLTMRDVLGWRGK
jgi:hypothetical protein